MLNHSHWIIPTARVSITNIHSPIGYQISHSCDNLQSSIWNTITMLHGGVWYPCRSIPSEEDVCTPLSLVATKVPLLMRDEGANYRLVTLKSGVEFDQILVQSHHPLLVAIRASKIPSCLSKWTPVIQATPQQTAQISRYTYCRHRCWWYAQ